MEFYERNGNLLFDYVFESLCRHQYNERKYKGKICYPFDVSPVMGIVISMLDLAQRQDRTEWLKVKK